MKNSRFESNKKYFTICVYCLGVIALGTLIIKCIMDWDTTQANISAFISTVSPFIAGAFIAYLLNPLVKKIDIVILKDLFKVKHEKVRKFFAILLSYIITIGVISIILFYILPQIVKSITDLTLIIPGLYNKTSVILAEFEQKYPNFDWEILENILEKVGPDLLRYLQRIVTDIVPVIYNTSIYLIRGVINVIIAVIVSSYMLYDQKTLLKNFKRLVYAVLNEERASSLNGTLRECNRIFGGFIIGKSIDSLIIGMLCFAAMGVLKLPYSLLMSVIVGVTNMIPYFGPFIGAIPGLLLLILISPINALVFGILILILQQFDGLVLGPKILGDSTGLKPLWIILAITIGGSVAGVAGMFFGVPVTAVISFLLNKAVQKRLDEKQIGI